MADYEPRHARGSAPDLARRRWPWLVVVGLIVVLGGAALWVAADGDGADDALEPEPTPAPTVAPTPAPSPVPTATPRPTAVPTATPTPYPGWVDPATSGTQWDVPVDGLLTFRGNPTRTYYGSGPVPENPTVQWWYPPGDPLCGNTTIGEETSLWCGTGWTGQPAVFERDGTTWTVFGAFDWNLHFLDADTGDALLDPFPTGDIIKGSVTIDPDGFPLVYSGSRDDYLHVVAVDREQPVELWRLGADEIPGRLWNNDWDGSPIIIDDYLFEGGENSIFHIVKLNRGYDDDGFVVVDPELVFTAPGYDDELLQTVGQNVSIENSVAISGNTVYFANSGGLVQGWDISDLAAGEDPERSFRYWIGDDVDATMAVDDEGFLYVGVEYERAFPRAQEVGQIVKLDPSNPDDPVVWGVFDTAEIPDGVWGSLALHEDLVIAPTDSGRMIGIDRATGEIRWEFRLPGPLWSSPVVVDDVLIQTDCAGWIHGYDVSDTTIEPPNLWSVFVGSCIESTPAVWDGRIIVGSRNGYVYMLADDPVVE